MPMRSLSVPFAVHEVMRYARVRQPRIIDLRQRAAAHPDLSRALAADPADRERWARDFLASDKVAAEIEQLRFDYAANLKGQALSAERLPSRTALLDPAAFARLDLAGDHRIAEDRRNTLATVLAARWAGEPGIERRAARLLAFVERYPGLGAQAAEAPYPSAVLERWVAPLAGGEPRPAQPQDESGPEVERAASDQRDELATLATDLRRLWSARTRWIRSTRVELDRLINAPGSLTPAPPTRKGKAAYDRDKQRRARQEARRNRIEAARAGHRAAAASGLAQLLALPAAALADAADDEWRQAQQRVADSLAKFKLDPTMPPCQAYALVLARLDALLQSKRDAQAVQNSAAALAPGCYREFPKLVFADRVRLLGHADLIRVDETFLRYTPGEVSYIENVLAGELRRREVKTVKQFEQLDETISEDSTDRSAETTVTSKLDLASQIESELNARMATDLNASANGSGGGTIGVIDVEGGASVGANLSLGLDTSLATSSSSSFSQEVVSKAIERTRRASVERRLRRSTSTFETLHSHEIDNRNGSPPQPRNGIYCFLDKHVCISETVYGKRLFLLAQLRLPGRNLLCQSSQRTALGRQELGARPLFDITVDDVQPGSYKTLVGRFKASNVAPPPAPVQTLGRTYKTDISNLNNEAPQFSMGKAAELLTPFFERYKRFLVLDTVRLPDGYQIAEVMVTVNHGRNGINVPAHLPLKLAGAALGSGLTMTAAAAALFGPAVLIPLGVWQFSYAASPLLHYNTDSSNVSVAVGNQSLDSSYYFFDPGFLMRELLDLFGSFLSDAPGLIDAIQVKAAELITALHDKAAQVPTDVAAMLQKAVDNLIASVQGVLNSIQIGGNLDEGLHASFGVLTTSLVDAQNLATSMGELFDPLNDFIQAVIGLFQEGLQSAVTEFFEQIAANTENAQLLAFDGAAGLRGELPVSLNAVAVHPGVTVNLVACLLRTDEALDRWRLETFESLYQAWAQQVAEWDARALLVDERGLARAPGLMRQEELLAVKERVLYALNNLHDDHGNVYDLDRIQFFENVLDWRNMNLRLYNYGPGPREAEREKDGLFNGADERRRQFLNALWAQVMVPAQPDARLEGQVIRYFQSGDFDFEQGLSNDELSALYQDLVLERGFAEAQPTATVIGTEVLPTDLLILQSELPANDHSPCTPQD